MQPWQQVQQLRKSGRLDEAFKLYQRLSTQYPGNLMLASQAEWVCYDQIKEIVTRIKENVDGNKRPDRRDLDHLHGLLQRYARCEPQIPGMAASNILNRLADVGHHFDPFVPFLQWLASDFLRPEDFDLKVYQGHTSESLATKVAREAAAWIEAKPHKANADQLAFVVDLVERVRNEARDEDKVWLEWSAAKLLRRAGDRRAAAELVARVLLQKRSEHWAWAEAGRIHRDEDPDLAISCFCQALCVGAEAMYLGRVHLELAEILASTGNAAQATRETLIAVEIYDQQGWRHPRELEALLRSDWYDPSLLAIEPSLFYTQHAHEALALCFDKIHEDSATFLGRIEGRDGKKPTPVFAVRLDDRVVSIRGRRGARLLHTLQPGTPVTVLIGTEGQRRDVLEVLPRPNGLQWDCAETKEGVVSWRPPRGDSVTVYCGRDQEIQVLLSHWNGSAEPSPGTGVRVWGAVNPARGYFNVYQAEPASLAPRDDIGYFRGRLSRTSKGFGFVSDVFVPAPLLENTPTETLEYAVVAIQAFDKTKQRFSWRAIAIEPSQQSTSQRLSETV